MVALTKTDLVDEELVELARMERRIRPLDLRPAFEARWGKPGRLGGALANLEPLLAQRLELLLPVGDLDRLLGALRR